MWQRVHGTLGGSWIRLCMSLAVVVLSIRRVLEISDGWLPSTLSGIVGSMLGLAWLYLCLRSWDKAAPQEHTDVIDGQGPNVERGPEP